MRDLKHVKVYSRSKERREAYAEEMSKLLNLRVEPFDDPQAVVRGSDIVSTCTDSIVPVLTNPHWLELGMHVTNLDMREFAGEDVWPKFDVVVRLGDQTMSRKHAETDFRPFHFAGYTAGQPEEIARIPKSRVTVDEEQYPKLVDVVSKSVPGRSSVDDITCFINIGTQGLQFASVGAKVYQLAKEQKVGRELPTEWFLQDVRD